MRQTKLPNALSDACDVYTVEGFLHWRPGIGVGGANLPMSGDNEVPRSLAAWKLPRQPELAWRVLTNACRAVAAWMLHAETCSLTGYSCNLVLIYVATVHTAQ